MSDERIESKRLIAVWAGVLALFVGIYFGLARRHVPAPQPPVMNLDYAKPVRVAPGEIKLSGHTPPNQSFQQGAISFVVVGSLRSGLVSNSRSSFRPAPGMVFLIVDYQAKNAGTENAAVPASRLLVLDSKGIGYGVLPEVSLTAMLHDEKPEQFSYKLGPGNGVALKAVFEIPLNILQERLTVLFPAEGSGNAVSVPLPP